MARNDDLGTLERLRLDVEGQVTFDRRTGTTGERRSAEWIAGQLTQIGADDARVSTFRTQASWVHTHLVHGVIALIAGLFRGSLARSAGVLTAISYELEVSGRNTWLRRMLRSRTGYSATARIPAARTASRTLVLVAHHDTAHTGLVWHPRFVALSRGLARRTGRALPSHLTPLLAMLLTISPVRRVRRAGQALLGTSALLMVQSKRSSTTPGANDNASGVAAVLELARRLRRAPLNNTEVLLVFPGGEEAGNYGMKAWLKKHAPALDPATTLVVNLDAVGSTGTLAVARRESLSGFLRTRDIELALQAARSEDVAIETVALPNATDAVAIRQANFPTISLASIEDGWISNLHRCSDTLDNLDLSTVEATVRVTNRIAHDWDRCA